MSRVKFLAVAAVAVICLAVTVPKAAADVNIQIGTAPDCPYGYYETPPYNCAPYGYYGPEWFSGGVFIGAGPWFHGDEHFRGHVDRRFDEHTYRGEYPHRGERGRHDVNRMENFRGNAMRDGRGHQVQENRSNEKH